MDKSFQHQGNSIRWQDHWLRFYRELAKHQGWHMVGYHRYWIGDIRLAYVNGYPANIRLDHPNHKDYQDPSKHRLTLERLLNGDLPPHWTGYADLWTKLLCIEHGIEIVEEMITEDWLDEKREAGSLPYNKYMDDNYPTEYDNGNGRGIWTWKAWSEASTGKPYITALRAQLEAKNTMHLKLEQTYPQLKGKQKGTHLFSFTPAEDWERAGHSVYTPPQGGGKYDERLLLINTMAEISEFEGKPMTEPTPIDPFNPTLYEANVRVTNGTWNMRPIMVASPSVEVIGELNTEARTMLVSKEKAQGSTYEWYKFKEGDIEGYFANTEKLDIQYAVDTTPNPPDQSPDTPAPDAITQEQVDKAVQDAIEPLEARIQKLEQDIANLLQPVIVDVPDVSWTAPRFALPMVASMFEGLELQFRLNKEFAQGGTPTPPVQAQGFDPLKMTLPADELDAQAFQPTDIGPLDIEAQNNPFPKLDNDDSNITISNEPADDDTISTVTDKPEWHLEFDENDRLVRDDDDIKKAS